MVSGYWFNILAFSNLPLLIPTCLAAIPTFGTGLPSVVFHC